MPRARKGAARRQAKNRWMDAAKGNRGGRGNLWRSVKQTVVRSGVYATEHRRLRKRDYRRLWVLRINAATRQRDMSYSRFMYGLKLANVIINRKMLSEIAIHDPAAFDALVKLADQAATQASTQQAAA